MSRSQPAPAPGLSAEGSRPVDDAHPAPPPGLVGRLGVFLEMIKVGHTLFALPFALGATFLAAGAFPDGKLLGKIVLAVLFARTAAMAFNRYVDRRIDGRNPRTAERAIPAGLLGANFVLATVLGSAALFVATAAWIGPLPLRLSPIALAVVLGYSLTKRFTALCHLALGAALALAPIGAWVAVRGTLEVAPWVLGAAVMLWTAGFDILYSTMDHAFDREAGLHSIPVRLGIAGALRVAALLHLGMVVALVALVILLDLGWIFRGTLAVVAVLLAHQHRLVRPDDLGRVNRVFFLWNVAISIALCLAMIAESLLVDGRTP